MFKDVSWIGHATLKTEGHLKVLFHENCFYNMQRKFQIKSRELPRIVFICNPCPKDIWRNKLICFFSSIILTLICHLVCSLQQEQTTWRYVHFTKTDNMGVCTIQLEQTAWRSVHYNKNRQHSGLYSTTRTDNTAVRTLQQGQTTWRSVHYNKNRQHSGLYYTTRINNIAVGTLQQEQTT